MNILLILLALILLVIASFTVIALGGHRAVPGAAFFNAVGRDGLGVFDTVDDLDVIAKPFRAPASQAVPAEGPRAVQEEPEPLPLAVPHTGNVERTLSAHDFVEHHVDKPSGASAVSSAEKPQSGEAR